MAIEKLYLTDTFRVWAEKFNATIDASNTATAKSEEAINKANEAIEKAESAAPKKHDSPNDIYGLGSNLNYGHMRGDGITTNGVDGEVIVKDVAIGGDTNDLARNRGQIGDCYDIRSSIDFNTLFKAGRYWFTNNIFAECSNKPPVNVGGFCDVIGEESNNSYTKQIYHVYNSPVIYIREHKGENSGWSNAWTKIITEKNLATSSTPGIVQLDNTTITAQDGIIFAKAMKTIRGTAVINNDFNNLVDAGMYYIVTTKGTTINSPIDVTAGWWVKVFVYEDADGNKRIIQEARMHSTTSSSATSGVANYLARCCTGTTWGPWEYAYTQFAG